MTNQEILEKAIQKAKDNGWRDGWDVNHTDSMGWVMLKSDSVKKSPKGLTAKVTYMLSENDIIFGHDFAKALWGEAPVYPTARLAHELWNDESKAISWQYHLQMMVIADDPIKYLGEHLDDKPF